MSVRLTADIPYSEMFFKKISIFYGNQVHLSGFRSQVGYLTNAKDLA